jgi:hypothetical protein
MTNRRDFLKHSALLGAATLSPFSIATGKERKPKSKSSASHAPVPSKTGYTVRMNGMWIPAAPPRQITIPDVEGFKVLKGDFHIHTLFSDGKVMPETRVEEAVQNGLDAIAITDHVEFRPFVPGNKHFPKDRRWQISGIQADDYNVWYDAAKETADKRNLLLIRGAEITKRMPPGHYNALFADDNNPFCTCARDWRTMLRTAVDHGAFILWDHPGWQHPAGGIQKGDATPFAKEHEEIYKNGWMHGIEVFNGTEYYPIVSDWCNERDLAIFANSDIHSPELIMYGSTQNPQRPITLVLSGERTVEGMREAFFAKRTIAWAAGLLWGRDPWLPALFKASVEVEAVTPGLLEMTNRSSLPVSVSVGGAVIDLPKDVKRPVYKAEHVNSITVSNWMTGMNKPLEITIKTE